MTQRYPEIDLLRTVAVLMMILFHYAFDLRFFYGWNINIFSGPWFWLGRLCAILFLLLVGISFVISWERTRSASDPLSPTPFRKLYPKYLRRGLFILGCGMLITAVTYWKMEDVYIRFGILHLIGTSILILPFFAKLREWNVLIGILLIGFPNPNPNPNPFLLPFGFHSSSFTSLDYYPLLPWFGVILLGFALGHCLYVRHPQWRSPLSAVLRPLSFVTWPSRNALLIYMIHQPIILGMLHFMI